MAELTDVTSHYEFGANWRNFAKSLPERAIEEAVQGLSRLVPEGELAGKDVLDIGCGSGLHALAALKLGAASVTAVDLDPTSVQTAREILERHSTNGRWSADVRSVFALDDMPQFPVVYSWGVLHHTGDMYSAIRAASERVAPEGLLIVALYRKTPCCSLWRLEKRIYSSAPQAVRTIIDAAYKSAFRIAMALQGRNFAAYRKNYVSNRGMQWETDVRDWLGGYPYESISEAEMLAVAARLGLKPVRRFCRKPGIGLFGTGCDEYVFRKQL